jgi:hypothetical protein
MTSVLFVLLSYLLAKEGGVSGSVGRGTGGDPGRTLRSSSAGAAMPPYLYTSVLFSSGFTDSRKNWGFWLALERILAWWQAAAVSRVHGVHARGERCSS